MLIYEVWKVVNSLFFWQVHFNKIKNWCWQFMYVKGFQHCLDALIDYILKSIWENTSQKNCSDSCWVGVAPVISSKTDMKSRTIFMSLSTAEMKKMIAWARTQKRTKPLSISLKCRFWFIHVGYSLTIWFVTSNQPCCPWDTVWVAKMNAL